MRKRSVVVGVVAAAAVVALAVPAGAGNRVGTAITLKVGSGADEPVAHGRVLSKEPACREGRTVVLHMVAPEQGPIDLADERTNAKGKWKFTSQLQGATSVQARVKRHRVDGTTCEGAVSPLRALDGGG